MRSAFFAFSLIAAANSSLLAQTPTVNATKTDTFTPNGAGKVVPGGTVKYDTTVTNTGTGAATGISIPNVAPANTTLLSTNVSPVALNDVYTAVVNTQLAVGSPATLSGPVATSATKVTDNDLEFLTDTFIISAVDPTSANGGTVTMVTSGANMGSFTYVPPVGFTGTDTFNYTIRDDGTDSTANNTDDLTGSGVVTINVTDANTSLAGTQKIWYIDNSYTGANGGSDGRSHRPFASLAAVSGATGSDVAGDTLYLATGSGNYTGGITLLADQTLWGQNEALGINTVSLVAAGADPVIENSSGNGVSLSTGNTLKGFTIGNTSTGDIVGTAAGTLTVSNLICNGTGPVFSISTSGALAVTLDTATTSSSTTTGISLSGCTGSFTANSGSISGVAGDDVVINGGTANVSVAAGITNVANRAVNVANKTAGTVTLSGAVSENGTGISLTSNTGSTVSFTGGLTASTTSNTAFSATGGGTVNITGSNNTLTTTTGTTLNVANTTIGASGLTFQSIAKNGGSNSAIVLNNTGSGTFTVTGTGSAGSGGTLQNIIGADAISLNTVGGLISLSGMNIQDITASGDSSAANNTHSGVDGIHGTSISGGLTLIGCTLQRISDNAVNGSVDASPVSGNPTFTIWSGLSLTNCTFANTNRFNVSGFGDATNESAVLVWGIKGTVSITGCSFSNTSSGLDFVTDTSGTLDLTAQSNTFTNLYKEIGTSSIGRFGISLVQKGNLSSLVRIGDPAESNSTLGNTFTNGGLLAAIRVVTDTGSTGNLKVSTSRNTSVVTDHSSPGQAPGNTIYNFPQGGVLYRALGSGNYEGIFANNTLNEVMNADGGLGQLTLIAEKGDTEFIVRNNTFQLPWNTSMEIRADGGAGGQNSCKVLLTGNTYIDGIVGDGSTDLGGQSPYEAQLTQVRNNGRMDITVQNEATPLGLTDTSSATGNFSFNCRTTTAGDILNLFLQNIQGPRGYRLQSAASTTYNIFRNGSVGGTPQLVLQDNGVRGGGGTDNTNPPTVNATGTINLISSAPALPAITAP
jgi:large repetitive protein